MKQDGKYRKVALCYVEGNEVAKQMYENFGFVETERDGDDGISLRRRPVREEAQSDDDDDEGIDLSLDEDDEGIDLFGYDDDEEDDEDPDAIAEAEFYAANPIVNDASFDTFVPDEDNM